MKKRIGLVLFCFRTLNGFGCLVVSLAVCNFNARASETSHAAQTEKTPSISQLSLSYLVNINHQNRLQLDGYESIELTPSFSFDALVKASNPIFSRIAISLDQLEFGVHWVGPLKIGVLIPATFPNYRLPPTTTFATTAYAQKTFSLFLSPLHLTVELMSDCYRYHTSKLSATAVSLTASSLLGFDLTRQTHFSIGTSIAATEFTLPFHVQYWSNEHFGWIFSGKLGLLSDSLNSNDNQMIDANAASLKLLQYTISGAWQF